MTKDQEYKFLFENWRAHVNEQSKTSSQEKQDLITYINNNKVNLTSDGVMSHLKSNYKNLANIEKSDLDNLQSNIEGILSKHSSLDYADEENVQSLATKIMNQADQVYSNTLYTAEPKMTKDQLQTMRAKAQEEFALGDRELTAAEQAALAALGATAVVAKAGIKSIGSAIGGWFKGKWDKLFSSGVKGGKGGKGGKPDLKQKFGPGKKGGKAAAKAIKDLGGKNAMKWARNKAIKDTTTKTGLRLVAKTAGKRALAFLGPVGAAAAGAWLLYDLYDAYYNDQNSVNEAAQAKETQQEIDKKILANIEELKKDKDFWNAFTSEIGREIDRIDQQRLKRKISISKTGPSGQKIKGDEKQRADALWSLVSQIATTEGVDPKLVMGIIHTENRFQNLSNNWGSGYMALTSIARKDARLRGGADISNSNKMELEANIRAGVALIKLIQRDLERALRRVKFDISDDEMVRLILYSYNRGVGAVVDGKGVPIGSPGKGKKYKHAGSKVFEKGLKEFNNIDDFIEYARSRYAKVLHGDYADRALRFANSYTPPSNSVS